MTLPIFNSQQAADLARFWKRVEGVKKGADEEREKVRRILEAIRKKGDAALLAASKKFDGTSFRKAADWAVRESDLARSRDLVDGAFQKAVAESIRNVTAFHKQQVPKKISVKGPRGQRLESVPLAVDRAGLYVPGGRGGATPLVSSAIMNVVPAKLAGVKSLTVVSPPRPEGGLDPHLLYVLSQLGVTDVLTLGGAQAIAALAYGTESIRSVDVITGPGNAWVTTAKSLVQGKVKIDGVFGHSEIVVIADGSVKPEWAAADLLSQAEHAGGELCVLLTDKPEYAKAVNEAVAAQLAVLPRKDAASASLRGRGAILVVPDLVKAVETSNRIAPEHLELLCQDFERLLPQVRHAGAVFCGPWATEPIGDYVAGTNHVLPTGGTARFSGALSVETFLKRTSVIRLSEKSFRALGPHAMRLAECEGLGAHRNAVGVRL